MSTNIDKEYENLLNATPESAPKIREIVDKHEDPRYAILETASASGILSLQESRKLFRSAFRSGVSSLIIASKFSRFFCWISSIEASVSITL